MSGKEWRGMGKSEEGVDERGGEGWKGMKENGEE